LSFRRPTSSSSATASSRPEYGWDDYKDVDVRGKVVVVMNNDPESDPALFGGTTRLWYGRWDYNTCKPRKKAPRGS